MSIDPETGKERTGASRRRKEKEAAEKSAGLSPEGGPGSSGDQGDWAEDFEEAGEPNLDDPGTDLDYVRKLQLVCLKQMATTPFPSVAQRNCWQRIREMSAVVGMTSNRAQLEAKVRRLEKALAEKKQDSGIVKVRDARTIKKPATARGETPPGPRPVSPEASVTAPPDEDKPEE